MLEFIEARIHLARARICESFDPELSNECMLNSYIEAKAIGINNPEMEPGALALQEPNVLEGFHEGVGNFYYWENVQNLK